MSKRYSDTLGSIMEENVIRDDRVDEYDSYENLNDEQTMSCVPSRLQQSRTKSVESIILDGMKNEVHSKGQVVERIVRSQSRMKIILALLSATVFICTSGIVAFTVYQHLTSQNEISALKTDVLTLESDLTLKHFKREPLVFTCYNTAFEDIEQGQTVTYHTCPIDNTKGGMNVNTGVFTASKEGIYQFSFSVGMKYSIVDLVVVKDHRTERLARVFDRNRGENHQTKTSAPVVVRLGFGDMVRVTVTEKYSTVRFPKKASEVIGEDKHITYFTGICLS